MYPVTVVVTKLLVSGLRMADIEYLCLIHFTKYLLT